jgi:hypothetical protein
MGCSRPATPRPEHEPDRKIETHELLDIHYETLMTIVVAEHCFPSDFFDEDNLLREVSSNDSWNGRFYFDVVPGGVRVASPGADHTPRTSDDLYSDTLQAISCPARKSVNPTRK